VPVVNFASEAGLAVLIALRYLPDDPPDDYVLGWTEIDAIPERAPDGGDEATRAWVAGWLAERRSLLASVRSKVLPEADVVLMNPNHLRAPARPRPARSTTQRTTTETTSSRPYDAGPSTIYASGWTAGLPIRSELPTPPSWHFCARTTSR
jgi:hypothetical protein